MNNTYDLSDDIDISPLWGLIGAAIIVIAPVVMWINLFVH